VGGTGWCETKILRNVKKEYGGTRYIISSLSEKVGGRVPLVPHLIAPMTVAITFHTLQNGSIRIISSNKKLIHLPWYCKTKTQTHYGADSRTELIADLKLFFRFAGFYNLASVLRFPYILPSYIHCCFPFQSCHQALKNELVTKTDQFCTAQRQVQNCASERKRSCL